VEHVEAILRGEQIAAAQHRTLSGMLLHLAEKLARAGALVALAHGAAMDRNGGHAQPKRAVEDREELFRGSQGSNPCLAAFSP